MGKLYEYIVETTREVSDIVALIFDELGSDGVRIDDPNDANEVISSKEHWDYYDYSLVSASDIVFVAGHLDSDKLLKEHLKKLKVDSVFDVGSLNISKKEITENWREEWRKFYKPIAIGKIIIVPEWIKDYDKSLIPVFIEPGMAFGTGSHESTAMCIRLICGIDFEGKNVVDLGCGSGILGLTAWALGAANIDMLDFDRQAIEIAKHNIKLNNAGERIAASIGDITKADSGYEKKYDCIIANLTADLLLAGLNRIINYAPKDCSVIISGIIKNRADEVMQEYEKYFEIIKEINDGDWKAFSLQLRGCSESITFF